MRTISWEYSRHCARTEMFFEELTKITNNLSQDCRVSNRIRPRFEMTNNVCASQLGQIFYFVHLPCDVSVTPGTMSNRDVALAR